MTPRVIVGIPVYNGMPHLVTAVESVLSQTYDNLQVFIVDNASTDGSNEYLLSITDERVTIITNDENIGMEGNWNKALGYASEGTYFKLVCADDLLYRNSVATEVAALEAHPEAVMTASRRVIIDDSGSTLIKARGLAGMTGLVDGKSAVGRSIQNGTNVLGEPPAVLLRSASIKGCRFDGTNKLLMDFDMWAQVLKHGALYAIADTLSAFRVGALSDSLKTVKQHRAMHIAEFKKLAAQPELGISHLTLYRSIAMTFAITLARQGFYTLLNLRKRFKG